MPGAKVMSSWRGRALTMQILLQSVFGKGRAGLSGHAPAAQLSMVSTIFPFGLGRTPSSMK
jgi:hypothetical protein